MITATRRAPLIAGFFDPAWYAARYPEILAAGRDPLQHFMEQGAASGMNPNRWFDGDWYKAYYCHVVREPMTALDHYLRTGARELRNPHPRFDAAWYVAQHPDAADNPMIYHLTVGEAQGWPTEPPLRIERQTGGRTRARVGIGIITFNRKDLLRQTIQRVRKFTRRPGVDFLVADDGSTDGTPAMLHDLDVPFVTGVNMGIAWNKNRALYLLGRVRGCDAVILLEDDTMPNASGWEDAWIDATLRWGHVSYAGKRVTPPNATGSGTPADPFIGVPVSAECCGYSAETLQWGGYFDTLFKGYGAEHIEHSRRLVRYGYGGVLLSDESGGQHVRFAMIRSGLEIHPSASFLDQAQIARNREILNEIQAQDHYRLPWRNMTELKQFRAEIESAAGARPDGFALHRSRRSGGGWHSLFRFGT
jgi:hypothetical protein